MRELNFIQADVFTDTPFGGNQLAVFLEGEGLDQKTMETLAREMNFSESTFVQKSGRSDCQFRVRICVPGKEIPFAGHPTVGTAAVLALRGAMADRGTLELGVGPVGVEVQKLGERRARAFMQQPRTAFGPAIRVEAEVAAALGLRREDLDVGFPMRVASAGLPSLLVPLRSREALGRIRVDNAAYSRVVRGAGTDCAYVYTLDSPDPGAHVQARMFAPDVGIAEDPATGSAAGPLAAHLAECGVPDAQPGRTLVIRQGVEMGRPSTLECSVNGLATANEGVRVGGGVEVVGEGRIFLNAG